MGYGITGWTPGGGRQSLTYSLKPGQKRGMGTGRIYQNNVVINNFGAMPRGVDMYYSHNCCNNNSGLSTFEKWMLGLGTGFGALGTVLGAIFGGGSNEGAGGVEEKPNDDKYQTLLDKIDEQQKAIDKLQKQLAKPATTPAAPAKPEPEPEPAEEATPQITKAKDGVLGSKADISGTVTVGENGEVSIKDVQNTYTYQKTGRTVNYNGTEYPVYQLTGATSNATGKALPTTNQEYILMNGELVQPSDCQELQGLGTGSIHKSQPTAATPKNERDVRPSGNKVIKGNNGYSATQKSDGSWEYRDNNGKVISDEEFKAKCPTIYEQTQGTKKAQAATTTSKKTPINNKAQQEVQDWNKQHPDKQVTYANGKYSTHVSTISTARGRVGKTITANSFDELKTLVNEYINSVNNNTNKYSTGGYPGLGGMMRH